MSAPALAYRTQQSIFERMLLMRHFEEAVIRLFQEKQFSAHYHVYIGQEATGAAAIEVLSDEDLICTTHRGHGHVVGRGADPGRALAEVLGRAAGFSGGRGGTLHLCDRSRNVLSTSGVVGGCAGLAAGAAYGVRALRDTRVVVAFFGDGALEEGLLPETFNIAALWKLPLVMICENNSGGAIGAQEGGYPTAVTAAQSLARIPACYGIPASVVDGADVAGVHVAMSVAVRRARNGGGPSFIEALTERWPGSRPLWPEPATLTELHAAWEPSRLSGPHARWLRDHDPVLRFARQLTASGACSREDLLALDEQVRGRIAAAAQFAAAAPLPAASTARSGVFAG